MQNNRQLESVHSIEQSRDNTEQLSTNQRRHTERLFEALTTAKVTNLRQDNAYISDLTNVQSLLNIRVSNRQSRRKDTASFEDRIIINVCGDRFETHRTTLELYPDTLLGNHKQRKYYFDQRRNEYFFDRNRACFSAILYYYQSHGRLRRPNFIPIDVFLEEVTFFQLGEEALKQLREDENIKEVKKVRMPKTRWRRHLWAMMEYPDYSILAKSVSILSLLMILISTISLAVESLPQYENTVTLDCKKALNVSGESFNSNDTNRTIQYLPDGVYLCLHYFLSPFFIIQTICVVFFTVELFLRIISTPSLFCLIKNPMNWIDIASIIPYYISLGIYFTGRQNQFNSATYICLRLLRIVRFVRVLKFYRVFKSIKSLRVLASTMKDSIPDFLMMIVILTLLSFLFGAAAYFAEHESNGQVFDSIMKATYWGVITITSVGYGDISPVTPIGRLIACLCALFGAAMIGMLVSVLVDRYQRVYARKLYKNEETIDFDECLDDETESKGFGSGQLHRRNDAKQIEDPDARAKNNIAFTSDESDIKNTTNTLSVPDIRIINESPISRHSSRIHFILGYVDDKQLETSHDLLDTVSSTIVHRQTGNENIQLTVLSDDPPATSHDVRFQVSSSSDEITDDDEELTEIGIGGGSRGNVLKKFPCPSTLDNKKTSLIS